jgi:hypothetical protein
VSKLALYAGTEIRLEREIEATFRLETDAPAKVWIDATLMEGSETFSIRLSEGTHRILIELDPNHLPNQLRLTSADVEFVLD